MKMIKKICLVLPVVLLAGNITGCTLVKEMFFSDISKDLCEQKDWAAVGEFALVQGNNLDSFAEYQSQCKKYFDVVIPDSMNDSFNFGYERARPSYCKTEKALSVGRKCGYYNIRACQGIVSEDQIIDLFNSFQEGNNTCVSDAYSNGSFAGENSVSCM